MTRLHRGWEGAGHALHIWHAHRRWLLRWHQRWWPLLLLLRLTRWRHECPREGHRGWRHGRSVGKHALRRRGSHSGRGCQWWHVLWGLAAGRKPRRSQGKLRLHESRRPGHVADTEKVDRKDGSRSSEGRTNASGREMAKGRSRTGKRQEAEPRSEA